MVVSCVCFDETLVLPHTCMQYPHMLAQIANRLSCIGRQRLEQRSNAAAHFGGSLWQHDSEFGQQPSHSVDRRRALFHESLANAMQT